MRWSTVLSFPPQLVFPGKKLKLPKYIKVAELDYACPSYVFLLLKLIKQGQHSAGCLTLLINDAKTCDESI
jgi:hypothetical protein